MGKSSCPLRKLDPSGIQRSWTKRWRLLGFQDWPVPARW